jgi:hypothetical protein
MSRPPLNRDAESAAGLLDGQRLRLFEPSLRRVDPDVSLDALLAAAVSAAEASNWRPAGQHGHGGFDPHSRSRTAAHWIQAYGLQQQLAIAEQFAAALDTMRAHATSPLLLVSPRGALLRCNEPAAQMLGWQDWLVLSHARISTAREDQRAAFHTALASAALDDPGPLAKTTLASTAGQRATVHIHRVPAQARVHADVVGNLVVVVDLPKPPVDIERLLARLQDAHALAPAEARLAIALHRHLKLSSAASALNISLGNARTTLKHVLFKTQQPNQQGLVLLVERALQ